MRKGARTGSKEAKTMVGGSSKRAAQRREIVSVGRSAESESGWRSGDGGDGGRFNLG
jgi:hypothetical protein